MGAGAPKDNKNAEKWTIEEATSFLDEAIEISEKTGYDFIGEVAKSQGSYIDIYDYLIEKFPALKLKKTIIKRNCEVNCFSSGKKGEIDKAMAIMNLKSNHGWTDRSESTIKGKMDVTRYTDEELEERIKKYGRS